MATHDHFLESDLDGSNGKLTIPRSIEGSQHSIPAIWRKHLFGSVALLQWVSLSLSFCCQFICAHRKTASVKDSRACGPTELHFPIIPVA
eukprot:3660187-Amphidinium_carterae.1